MILTAVGLAAFALFGPLELQKASVWLALIVGLSVELAGGALLLAIYESIQSVSRTRDGLNYNELSESIRTANKSIKILTTFWYVFCDDKDVPEYLDRSGIARTRDALVRAIKSGNIKIEILVLDPRSDGAVAREHDRPEEHIRKRIFENIEFLKILAKQYSRESTNTGTDFSVRVYDALPQISLIQIDDILSVSFYEKRSISLTQRIESHEDQPLGKFVRNTYRHFWDSRSRPLLEYVKTYPQVSPSDFTIETLIIGGGPAGVAAGKLMNDASLENVVVERGALGESWRNKRWDSLRVVGPNWNQNLIGQEPHPEPDGFARRDEVVERLEQYSSKNKVSIRTGCEVLGLREISDSQKGFRVKTNLGRITCRNAIVATGAFNTVNVPEIAQHVPSHIVQITSATYKNPDSIPPGEVLVVGGGQSGFQIADELSAAGRQVHLSIGKGYWWRPRKYRGKDTIRWAIDMGRYEQTIDSLTNGDRGKALSPPVQTGRNGGEDLNHHILADRQVKLYGRLKSITNTRIEFESNLAATLARADSLAKAVKSQIDKHVAGFSESDRKSLAADDWPIYREMTFENREQLLFSREPISAVIWATGYKPDYSWINCDVLGDDGYPIHRRGVTEIDGLYFLGLDWLFTAKSSILSGLGDDARFLVEKIQEQKKLEDAAARG